MKRYSFYRAVRSISLLWFCSIGNAAIGFFAQVALARALSPSTYGTLSAAVGTVALVVPLAGFGLANFLPKIFGEEGWHGHRWLQPLATFTGVTTALSVIGVLLWASYGPHDKDLAYTLCLISPMIVAGVASTVVGVKLQLEARYERLAIWQLLPSASRAFLIVLIICFADLTLKSASIAYFLGAVVVILFSISPVLRVFAKGFDLAGHGPKKKGVGKENKARVREVLSLSWPFGLASIMYLIYYQSDVILLRYLADSTSAGVYSVAFSVMAAIYLFPSVVYQKFMLPKLHRWAASDQKKLLSAYRAGNGNMLVLGFAVCAGVIFFVGPMVPLVFGKEYEGSAEVLEVLALCIPIRFLASSVGSVLTTGAHMRRKVVYMSVVAFINVTANTALIPRFGSIGAAVATLISESLLLVLYVRAVKLHVFGTEALTGWRVGFK